MKSPVHLFLPEMFVLAHRICSACTRGGSRSGTRGGARPRRWTTVWRTNGIIFMLIARTASRATAVATAVAVGVAAAVAVAAPAAASWSRAGPLVSQVGEGGTRRQRQGRGRCDRRRTRRCGERGLGAPLPRSCRRSTCI